MVLLKILPRLELSGGFQHRILHVLHFELTEKNKRKTRRKKVKRRKVQKALIKKALPEV